MKRITIKVLLVAALAARTAAANNAYNNQTDLLLAFRESGFSDMVIDIGPAGTYLTAGSTINLDTVIAAAGNATYPTLASLLNHVYGAGAASVTWSVCGGVRPGATASAIYVTDPSDTTTPIIQSAMNGGVGDIYSYGNQYATATVANTIVTNLAATVPSGPSSYTTKGPAVSGAVGFTVESLLSGTTSKADFYSFAPNATGVKATGYFEIDSNGTGRYVVAAQGPPQPTLTITRNGSMDVISFTSAASFTYTLHGTNSAGLTSALSTWPASATTITGNGSTQSFTNTPGTNMAFFYSVSAH